MSNNNFKPFRVMSQYQKVETVIDKLQEYFDDGYKLFNIYHYRTKDILFIQLKDGNGGSKTLKYKCTFPIYRIHTKKLNNANNKFKSLHYIPNNKCDKLHVTSDVINEIGNIDTDNKQVINNFDPSKYLVYNVLRPEYYITTNITQNNMLTFEETRVFALDIETPATNGFPEPKKAEQPLALLTIFDFKNVTANVFYLNEFDIDDSVENIQQKIMKNLPDIELNITFKLKSFESELDLINSTVEFLNDNADIVVGWNLNEFDITYIVNRHKNLERKRKEIFEKHNVEYIQNQLEFGMFYDGFTFGYAFNNFVCVDLMSVYKFFVDKNPPTAKLSAIAKKEIKVSKIESETFLDIAYNVTDTLLLYLMENKLNLIQQMFSFKMNGAVLHVFNVRNALEPLIIKLGASENGSFIANRYTIYYNIYYNEVYKLINRHILKLTKDDLKVLDMKNIVHFLTHLNDFDSLIKSFIIKADDDDEDDDEKKDSIGAQLSKIVDKFFRKRKTKKKSDSDNEVDEESSVDSLIETTDEKEVFDKILFQLFGINIDRIFGYPGAFNKSFRGLAKILIDLDFFSMYPVIMCLLNISIETAKFLVPMKLNIFRVFDTDLYSKMIDASKNKSIWVYDFKLDIFTEMNKDQLEKEVYNDDGIIANSGMIFGKEPGFISKMCKHFLEIRSAYKDKMEKESDPVAKSKYNIYQKLYKVYNNSIYGYMGYKYSVIFNRLLVASVTLMGRIEILYANERMISYFIGNDEVK